MQHKSSQTTSAWQDERSNNQLQKVFDAQPAKSLEPSLPNPVSPSPSRLVQEVPREVSHLLPPCGIFLLCPARTMGPGGSDLDCMAYLSVPYGDWCYNFF